MSVFYLGCFKIHIIHSVESSFASDFPHIAKWQILAGNEFDFYDP